MIIQSEQHTIEWYYYNNIKSPVMSKNGKNVLFYKNNLLFLTSNVPNNEKIKYAISITFPIVAKDREIVMACHWN